MECRKSQLTQTEKEMEKTPHPSISLHRHSQKFNGFSISKSFESMVQGFPNHLVCFSCSRNLQVATESNWRNKKKKKKLKLYLQAKSILQFMPSLKHSLRTHPQWMSTSSMKASLNSICAHFSWRTMNANGERKSTRLIIAVNLKTAHWMRGTSMEERHRRKWNFSTAASMAHPLFKMNGPGYISVFCLDKSL